MSEKLAAPEAGPPSDPHDPMSAGAGEASAFGTFTVRHMAAFSSGFFQLARRFALESNTAPPLQADLPMSSVIMAATALEAFVNEQIEFAGLHDQTMRIIGEELHESRGLSIEAKWTILTRLLCGQTFDGAREPYQSFGLLIDLRNVLVHRASRFMPVEAFPNKRVKSLSDKFQLSTSPDGGNISWERRVLNPSCARWAVNTASAMVAEHWQLTARVQPSGRGQVTWEGID